MRKYDEIHRKQDSEEAKRRYKTLKSKVFEILGGAVCVNCGCNVESVLEINHINGGGYKASKITSPVQFRRNIINGKVNILEYNILCRLCNTLHDIENRFNVHKHVVIWK